MAPRRNLNDPKIVSALRAALKRKSRVVKASSTSATTTAPTHNPESAKVEPTSPATIVKSESHSLSRHQGEENADRSPAVGLRAPPSTPIAQARTSLDKVSPLKPIKEEDNGAVEASWSDSPLKNQPAPVQRGEWDSPEQMSFSPQRPVATSRPINTAMVTPYSLGLTPTQKYLLRKKEIYDETILRQANKGVEKETPDFGLAAMNAIPFPEFDETPISRAENGVASAEAKKGASGLVVENDRSPTIVVAGCANGGGGRNEGEDESTISPQFESQSTPAARREPTMRIRTAVLVGFPPSADFSLVQSYVHGGTIEVMKLSPVDTETGRVTAYVTFTNGGDCDYYCYEYANGMVVRHMGVDFSVSVRKSNDEELVSDVMQAYLDCGATRVIKVMEAPSDWGILAMHALDEGRSPGRQVESITDTYQNQTRTITFRFTSISDAAKFKGNLARNILVRKSSWVGCRIEFGEDPCENAGDFHP